MTINAATKENLRRKTQYVDKVQLHKGVPLPSWVDLSLTELCNRSGPVTKSHAACIFCPRIDPSFYPNQNLHMELKLVEKIALELDELSYEGAVVLCGFGEPLLHPEVIEIVRILSTLRWGVRKIRVEVVTNGDYLGPKKIGELSKAGVDYFVVSLYDGPHQVDKMKANFKDAGWTDYILRDRWHTEADQFGLKLTNRAGTVTVGPQEPVDTHKPCYYLAYQMTVDWNGDVLLCPQDWHKRVKYGNLGTESLFDVWTSPRMQKRRRQLIEGRRSEHPCSGCNTDGTLHGFVHAPAWQESNYGKATG